MEKQIDYKSKELFKEVFLDRYEIDNYNFPTNKFSRYDLVFKANDIYFLVEIKKRRCNSTDYPDTLLEKSKFDIMNELAQQVTKGRCIPIYCAMFNDCYYLFRLDAIDYYTGKVRCSRTTDFRDRRMRTKDVVYLDFKDGVKYNY